MSMDTRTYTLGPASCRVRRTQAVPAHMREHVRELAALQVPAAEQGKGYATTLVHKVCRDADAAGVVLVLWPQPFGDVALSADQLAAWYAREFGFQVIQPEPMLMARPVDGTPRLLTMTPAAEAAALAARGLA